MEVKMSIFQFTAQAWIEGTPFTDGWVYMEFQIEARDLAQAAALASESLGENGGKYEILSIVALENSETEE
jgi:hypothetical protein